MDSKERIVEKANELFNRFGFRRVTMDEIASKSGMSKRTIYQSFAHKHELIDTVVKENIDKSIVFCEESSAKAENAIHEIFLGLEMTQKFMAEMSPSVFEEMEKFFPDAFAKFYCYKNTYIFEKVLKNLERGIEEELFREEINVDIMTKFRIETMFTPFDQNIFPYTKYNIATVQSEILELYLYGISTTEGQKLINRYKKQRNKNI